MQPRARTVAKRIRLRLLALLLAAWGAGCVPVAPGVYELAGEDERLGAFEGSLEIRREGTDLRAIRVVRLLDERAPDGRAIEMAWTGTVGSGPAGDAELRFSLTRADFIPRVGGLERTEADALPLEVSGRLQPSSPGAFQVVYRARDDPSFGISEAASYAAPNGDDPIFEPRRLVRETHPEAPAAVRGALFDLFSAYHAEPAVQPWVDHPAFQRGVHYQVEERTDFRYYRDHPDAIRVVNKVVDAISLAETEIRANAFRATLREKADFYQQELSSGGFLREHGMIVRALDADGNEIPDHDGALWTGVHALGQAIRHRHTGSLQALSQVRRILRGMFTLMDITGDPATFARTLRDAGPPIDDEWVRGTGEYAHLDWERGGNNDMAKGLTLAFVAAMDVLPPGDPLWPELRVHAAELQQLCIFRADTDSDDCEGSNPLFGGLDRNPAVAWLIDAVANDDDASLALGLEWLRRPGFETFAAIGGGTVYVQGISDWSGNHLNLAGALPLVWLLRQVDAHELSRQWEGSFGAAWEWLDTLEHPLHAATAVSLGGLAPEERARAVEQARWGLRAFPFPKHRHAVDHSIRGDFVLSPYPSLPWKLDWSRLASLVGHGILESVADSYVYNDMPVRIRSGGIGELRISSADYLFLYWLARDAGIIDERA